MNYNSLPVRLVFMPDWSQYNPYQKLLYREIEASGISTQGLNGAEFTFSWILKNRGRIHFIHMHWLHGIYSQSHGLGWGNATRFLMKVLFSKILGYRLLWTVHNIVSHEMTNPKLELFLRKMVAKAVDHLIVHCEFAQREICQLLGVPKNKVTAIPHGSYIGFYPNNISTAEARKLLGIPADQFTFLFFGMLRNYKGVKELLGSYKELKNKKHNIGLIIAGQPHNKQIRVEIEKMATGTGIALHLRYISDHEVQNFFNASDVVVLPYLNILTSGSAVLALSFGKPVIAPAKGCIPELLDETLSFLYHNKRELTGAMADAVTRKDMSEMREKAFKRAEELKWNKIVADSYLPLLRKF